MSASEPTPLYYQVKRHLRDRITSGCYPAGAQIPPEGTLEREFGVSRTTVRKAVEELVDEGFLLRRRGVGTFVSDARSRRQESLHKSYLSLGTADIIRLSGKTATRRLLGWEEAPATEEQAALFGIPVGERIVVFRRLELGDGVAVSHGTTEVPGRYVGDFASHAEEARRGFYALLASLGNPVHRVEYQVTTVSVDDAEVVRDLGVEPGSANLLLTNVSLRQDGTALERTSTIIDARRVVIPISYTVRE